MSLKWHSVDKKQEDWRSKVFLKFFTSKVPVISQIARYLLNLLNHNLEYPNAHHKIADLVCSRAPRVI